MRMHNTISMDNNSNLILSRTPKKLLEKGIILIIFDIIQRADAEADMDFFAADLQVQFGIKAAEEKAEGDTHIITVDVNDNVCRA